MDIPIPQADTVRLLAHLIERVYALERQIDHIIKTEGAKHDQRYPGQTG